MLTRALDYISAFNAQDLPRLRDILAPDVVLHDWETHETGIESVLQAMSRTFGLFPHLNVTPVRLIAEGSAVAAQLRIQLDGSTAIDVVDLLDFSADGRLQTITAYKG